MNFETSVFILDSFFPKSFISQKYHRTPRNLKIFTNSYPKNKWVVKVTDWEGGAWRRGNLQTSPTGDLALGEPKVQKDLLNFSLSCQLCSDIRINSKIHHRFQIISWWPWVVWDIHQSHLPGSRGESEKHFRPLESQTPAPDPPMTISWVNNTCLLKKYRNAILLLY